MHRGGETGQKLEFPGLVFPQQAHQLAICWQERPWCPSTWPFLGPLRPCCLSLLHAPSAPEGRAGGPPEQRPASKEVRKLLSPRGNPGGGGSCGPEGLVLSPPSVDKIVQRAASPRTTRAPAASFESHAGGLADCRETGVQGAEDGADGGRKVHLIVEEAPAEVAN